MAARVRAPELNGGSWVNTAAAITLADLRGRVVLLDFWTFSCVNCLRVLDELQAIEAQFAEEVTVIGVHAPKFPHEHDRLALIEAVARLRIAHPVIDDPELRLWKQYGIKGWPTIVVIDPEGYVVGGVSGEGNGPVLVEAIEAAIASHHERGSLRRGPAPAVAAVAAVAGVLAFPGKVASDGGRRLAIADTGHDRVLVTDLGGRVEWEITGLRQPQGVRFDGGGVVICDTGADRVVYAHPDADDLEELAAGLASPWDVVPSGRDGWVVAEAGRHRLWLVRRGAEPELLAGSGREDLVDGDALDGALAQPSGLARLPGGYAIADAEASALRVLTDDGRLATLVGQGLFDWGDADGDRADARLQHPLGVAADPTGRIFVADTFNHRIRRWEEGRLTTLAVENLDEPGGIDVMPGGRLVVADTNHHRIITVDPDTGVAASLAVDDTWTDAETGDPITSGRDEMLSVTFDVDVDDADLDGSAGYPVRVVIEADPPALLGEGPRRWDLARATGTIEVRAGDAGSGTLVIDVVAATCSDGECSIERVRRRHVLHVT